MDDFDHKANWLLGIDEPEVEMIDPDKIAEAWAQGAEDLVPADYIRTSVFVERSTASMAADPAGRIRRACADGFDRHGIGVTRELISYGWGYIQLWLLRSSANLGEAMRLSLSALTDHTTVDLARAFRHTPHSSDGPELFIVLGSAKAEIPEALQVGFDAEFGPNPMDVQMEARYGTVLMLGVLGGAPTDEMRHRCEISGGAAMPLRSGVEVENFVERCGATYARILGVVEGDCDTGEINLREIFGYE